MYSTCIYSINELLSFLSSCLETGVLIKGDNRRKEGEARCHVGLALENRGTYRYSICAFGFIVHVHMYMYLHVYVYTVSLTLLQTNDGVCVMVSISP